MLNSTLDPNHTPITPKSVGTSAEISRNIRWVIYSFIGAVLALIVELLLDFFFITPLIFSVVPLPFIALFVYFLVRLNSMGCPKCGEKLGRLYGMVPFFVFHDFDLEKCKHCHHDLN